MVMCQLQMSRGLTSSNLSHKLNCWSEFLLSCTCVAGKLISLDQSIHEVIIIIARYDGCV
jgi:hypothetical protein